MRGDRDGKGRWRREDKERRGIGGDMRGDGGCEEMRREEGRGEKVEG